MSDAKWIWERLNESYPHIPYKILKEKNADAIAKGYRGYYTADQHWRKLPSGVEIKPSFDLRLAAEELNFPRSYDKHTDEKIECERALNLGDALRFSAICAYAYQFSAEDKRLPPIEPARNPNYATEFWDHVCKQTGYTKTALLRNLSVGETKPGKDILNRMAGLRLTASYEHYSKIQENVREALLAYLNSLNEFHHLYRAKRLSHQDVWGPYLGAGALKKFWARINLQDNPRQIFQVSNYLIIKDNEERQERLKDVAGWIASPQQNLSDIVRVVYGQGMWRGLSAFGQAVAKDFDATVDVETDKRSCMFLPLGVGGQLVDSKSELTLPYEGGHLEVLSLLRHFYTEPYDTIEDRLRIQPTEDLNEIMHEIRIGMTKRPRVLILDGIYQSDLKDPLDLLERFSNGNTLLGIISRIIDAPLAAIKEEELETFLNNRILILTNKKLGETADHKRWSLPHAANGPREWQLPKPWNDHGKDIVGLHGFSEDRKEAILGFRKSHPEFQSILDDLAYFALDGVFSLLHERRLRQKKYGLEILGNHLARCLPFHNTAGEAFVGILQAFLDLWNNKDALQLKLILFVTLVPDGVRRTTLKRLVKALLDLAVKLGADPLGDAEHIDPAAIKEPDVNRLLESVFSSKTESYTHAAPAAALDRSTVNEIVDKAINQMLSRFPLLLTERSGDYVPGYDDVPKGLEFVRSEACWPLGDDEDVSANAITFTFPEFRVRMRGLLADKFGLAAFQLSCRFLALDAMAQQAVAFRHIGVPHGQLMRPWRRQVTMILLGLQSLPITLAEDEGRSVPKIDKAYDEATKHLASQYRRSRDLFRYLYHFAYRRQIEAPPAYILSRLYSMQSFKDALLRAFEQPWSLLPSEILPRELSKTIDSSLIDSEFSDLSTKDRIDRRGPQKNAVLRSHYASLLTTRLALGRIENARTALNRMRRYRDNVDLQGGLSILKRDLDICLASIEGIEEAFERFLNDYAGQTGSNGTAYSTRALQLLLTPPAARALFALIRKLVDEHLGYFRSAAKTEPVVVSESVRAITIMASSNDSELPKSTATLSAFADILFRIAEYVALQADYEDIPVAQPNQLKLQVPEFFADKIYDCMSGIRPTGRPSWLFEFCRSLALFRIAEQVRLESFNLGPTSSGYFSSGHATRQMIRVALKLENHRRRTEEHWGAAGYDSVFADHARYGASVLATHLFRYGRERAAMRLLEVSMLRLLVRDPLLSLASDAKKVGYADRRKKRKMALQCARDYLARTEASLHSLGHKSRWRMRLSLERCKIHRALFNITMSEANSEQDPKSKQRMERLARFYLNLADLDAKLLKEMSESVHNYNLWKQIATHQSERVSALSTQPKKS